MNGYGGTKNAKGVVNSFTCQGAPLVAVLNSAGGVNSNQSVKLTAADNYTKTITYDQLMNGVFSTYDSTGNATTPSTKPTVCLVYSANGAALDSATGPVELGIIFDQNYVTDGSWWVRMVQKIEVVTPQ